MIFRQKDFWMNVPKGTEVVVKKSDNPKPMKLYFDEVREFTDYGLEMIYVCLQKDVKDLGNRSLTVPLVVDDIDDVISVGGKAVREFRKEMKSNAIVPTSVQVPSSEEHKSLFRKLRKHKPSEKPDEKPELLANPVPVADPSPDTKSDEKKDDVKPVKPSPRKRKEYGFEITEKDGKFFCPCGSSFGRRDTAIYVHRTRHTKKPE
jgi:hypothetical protein